MSNTVLIGAQWGDEGKGKIVDVLARDADVVGRYQGGSNAGHTIEIGCERYVLHLVPSGIMHPGKRCVIGHGLVVDPLALVREIHDLEARGVTVRGRLEIGDRAHIVGLWHRRLDAAREDRAAAGARIGTTQRGIGPAYADKAHRIGLRLGDLLEAGWEERVWERLDEANVQAAAAGAEPLDATQALTDLRAAGEALKPYIGD